MRVSRPHSGARWALAWGEVRRAAEKAVRASVASALPDPSASSWEVLYWVLKLRSQTASSARPWAMLARRATVQGVLASKSLSSVSIFAGSRYPASTYGSAVLARVDSDKRRKVLNSGSCDAEGGDSLWCARYDSSPLLKANEPRGRAESDNRSRAWRAEVLSVRTGGLRAAVTDQPHCPAQAVLVHRIEVAIVLWHCEDASQGQLSHPGDSADCQVQKSWKEVSRMRHEMNCVCAT